MKKLTITILILALLVIPLTSTQAANSITERLSGKLLLQVEGTGQIWWVNPVDKQKYEVTFANAMDLFRSHALGISNEDLSKIPIAVNSVHPSADADSDGYTDREEWMSGYNPFGPGKQNIDTRLANRLMGRFLLQVENCGRIWYVDDSLYMHEVKFATLMDLFRGLALGITDDDLEKVGTEFSISSTIPAKDSVVKELSYIKIFFSQAVNSGTLNNDNFYVLQGLEEKRPATITYNSSEKSATLTFTQKAIATQNYEQRDGFTVVLNSNIKDLAGNSLVKQTFNIDLATTGLTENWQTYTNSKYGYQIKYPNNWYVDTTYSDSPFTVRSSSNIGGDTRWWSKPDYHLYREFPADGISVGLMVWQNKTVDYFNQQGIKTYQSIITESGVRGDQYLFYDPTSSWQQTQTFFQQADKLYQFSLGCGEQVDCDKALQIYNQMMSSFKFSEAVDGLVYVNNDYSFKTKYPTNWYIRDCKDYVGFSYSISNLPTCYTNQPQPHVNIKIMKGYDSFADVEEYTQDTVRHLDNYTQGEYWIGDIKATKIEGQLGQVDGPSEPIGTKTTHMIFRLGDTLFDFYYYELDNLDYIDIFDQVVSNFELL